MDQRKLAQYYTITPEEKSVINQQRGASNRLGYAIQDGGCLSWNHL
jgi:hypothetical protein